MIGRIHLSEPRRRAIGQTRSHGFAGRNRKTIVSLLSTFIPRSVAGLKVHCLAAASAAPTRLPGSLPSCLRRRAVSTWPFLSSFTSIAISDGAAITQGFGFGVNCRKGLGGTYAAATSPVGAIAKPVCAGFVPAADGDGLAIACAALDSAGSNFGSASSGSGVATKSGNCVFDGGSGAVLGSGNRVPFGVATVALLTSPGSGSLCWLAVSGALRDLCSGKRTSSGKALTRLLGCRLGS